MQVYVKNNFMVGEFIADQRENLMIEPAGGSEVSYGMFGVVSERNGQAVIQCQVTRVGC